MGSTTLSTPTHNFTLSDVSCAPSIHKNLLFVSQFCKHNQASIEFFPTHFLVKDLSTGASIVHGMNRGNVYEWPSPTISPKSSPHVFITTKVSFNHWHRRLGHHALKILKNVVSSHSLPVSETTFDFCNSCLCNKSHWLLFEIFSLTSSWPLELIYTDVWGPAPVISFDNYRYYVIFVDHFTKYI